MVLLKKEMINGVITHDILEVLKKVCTTYEYKEFLKLDVETAVLWKKSDQVFDIKEWADHVLKDNNSLTYSVENQGLMDKRTIKWFAFPINIFIDPLLEKRNFLKKMYKNEKNPERKKDLFSQQNSVKLMINTLYGVFASKYFKIGNTVLADNITAKGRTYLWILSKSLNCNQTITDGSCYGLKEVFFLKQNGRKPSLDTLSNLEKLKNHRSIKKGSLGG